MMPFISPRLRKPVGVALAGAAFAAAWLVRGGPLWWVSILAVILAAARAVSRYRMGREGHRRRRAGRVQGGRAPRGTQPAVAGPGLQSGCDRRVHRPDGRDCGQGHLVVAVHGYPRRRCLWLPAWLVELRCGRAGPG